MSPDLYAPTLADALTSVALGLVATATLAFTRYKLLPRTR